MTCLHSLSLSVSSDTGDDPSSGGAPPSTDSQPIGEDTVMDLDRTEVSDTSESSLHCTICGTCHSCPVEPALCPLPSLFCMLLCCNHPPLSTSVHCICMYLVLRMVLHMVVIQCLDSFPFQFCSLTNGHASCRWCCTSYQLHGIMEYQCRVCTWTLSPVYVCLCLSVYVCVEGGGGGQAECDLDNVTSYFHLLLL